MKISVPETGREEFARGLAKKGKGLKGCGGSADLSNAYFCGTHLIRGFTKAESFFY